MSTYKSALYALVASKPNYIRKMEALVNELCEAYFYNHPDVVEFWPTATFERFNEFRENRNVPIGEPSLRYTFLHGHIEFRVDGQLWVSDKVLVKYYDSRQQQADANDPFASFDRETAFFRDLLPVLKRAKSLTCVPKLGSSRTSADGTATRQVSLFECFNGNMDFACPSFLDALHLSLMVRQIAYVHVAYWLARSAQSAELANIKLSSADPNLWTPEKYVHLPYAQLDRIVPLLRLCFQAIRNVAHSTHTTAHSVARERLRQMLDNFEERLRAPFSLESRNTCWTMCHQSYGQNNVVFEYDGYQLSHVRIFNWQSMGFASLGVDLVIVLFVEQNMHWDQTVPWLVHEYLEALQELPVAERPTLEAINAEVKRCVPVALYVLADRVLRASSQIFPDGTVFPARCWNEQLITNLFRYLIRSDFA